MSLTTCEVGQTVPFYTYVTKRVTISSRCMVMFRRDDASGSPGYNFADCNWEREREREREGRERETKLVSGAHLELPNSHQKSNEDCKATCIGSCLPLSTNLAWGQFLFRILLERLNYYLTMSDTDYCSYILDVHFSIY